MHTGRVQAKSVYKMEGQNLEKTGKERDLGVIFNSKLDVSDHGNGSQEKGTWNAWGHIPKCLL